MKDKEPKQLLEQDEAKEGLLMSPFGHYAFENWQARNPSICPMCGFPYFEHETFGGCPYDNPELLENENDESHAIQK